MRDRSTRYAVISAAAVLAMVAAVLYHNGRVRHQQFREFHQTSAIIAARGVAAEVAAFVSETRRRVTLFAREHRALLEDIVARPAAREAGFRQLKARAREFFPRHFALMVMDAGGRPLMDDFEGRIGEVCLADMREFLARGHYRPRIHPNPVAYHFDTMARWGGDPPGGLLFVSFPAEYLGRLLAFHQGPRHVLLLVDREAGDLIEVTPDGARIKWSRDDYHLTPAERNRILAEASVPGTRWSVVVLHTPGLFAHHARGIQFEALSLLAAFLLLVLLSLSAIVREGRRRAAAERAKRTFFAAAGHELRTPLTAIRGALGLIANGVTGEVDEKTRTMAAMGLDNAERLGRLVDDLLDLQRMEAGRMEFRKETLGLTRVVEQALRACTPYAERAGARLRLVRSEPHLLVHADPQRLEQVLANLLSNAVKYGAEGDTVEVSVFARGGNARVEVADHGPGIPDQRRGEVFIPFSRAGGRRETGSGLGLYIARTIVEAHGGQLGYTRTGDGRTVFWFELPRVQGTRDEERGTRRED